MDENEKLTDVETDDLDAEDSTDVYDTEEEIDDAETEEDDLDADYDYYDDELDDDSNDESDDDTDEDTNESDEDEPEKPGAGTSAAENDRVAKMERKLAAYERHGKRALNAIGVNNDDVLAGLEQLSADAEGKTLDQYRQDTQKEDAESAERAEFDAYKRRKANLEFEKKALADLEAIQSEYPETKKYKHFSELPNHRRYAELMATGKMTAVEAYIASHPKEARQGAAAAAKQQSLNDTKRHMKSNVPKNGGNRGESYISKSEMRRYREMFPDMSDKEIRALHKRATS